jgi:alanine dehydrogenase
MIVGVPKELKDNEYRVALTPEGARELTHAGHRVLVERGAGQILAPMSEVAGRMAPHVARPPT